MHQIIKTDDGSDTLYNDMAQQTYHSTFGAIQESEWIFIDRGLKYYAESVNTSPNLKVLEIGFGTGLNALLAAKYADLTDKNIEYTTTELFPIDQHIIANLNYGIQCQAPDIYKQLHMAKWSDSPTSISKHFAIRKLLKDISKALSAMSADPKWHNYFDIIMFDAFSPEAQPELWTENIFRNIYNITQPKGILTTYCAKGDVRRALISAGFIVEKLQGPPGKRHIVRATKP